MARQQANNGARRSVLFCMPHRVQSRALQAMAEKIDQLWDNYAYFSTRNPK